MGVKTMWVMGVLMLAMLAGMGYGMSQERKQALNAADCGYCHRQNLNVGGSSFGMTYGGTIGIKIAPGLVLKPDGFIAPGYGFGF